MQCRAKRYRIAANKKANIPLNQAAFHTAQRCKKYYGFLANPNISLQHNFNNTIIQADTIPLLQPFNLTFHNLCKVNDIPKGTKELLGLNLIIQKNKKCNLNNLTPLQLQALKALKNNKNFTIKPTNKNLALPSWTLNSISSKFLPSTCFL